ncbi:MAG: hypothetical protein ACTHXA_08615 [Gulosibacter sp.]|uniref:hypothetical protein n=1 Tax=Gulosibacter sp. TaxID=2817531 RepID=UPI003F9224A3
MTTATDTPITVVTLDREHDPHDLSAPLACRDCGIRVDGPHDRANVEVLQSSGFRMETILGSVERERPSPIVHTAVTRCESCAERVSLANELLDQFPKVRLRIGSRSIADARVLNALIALDALGVRLPKIDSDRELVLLLNHMTRTGSAVRFDARLTGPTRPGAAPGCEFSAAPWTHVPADIRGKLRGATAAYLKARVDTPRPIAPPDGHPRGCLLCGVSTQLATAATASTVWARLSISPDRVGGERGAKRVNGVVCRICDRAIDKAGSVGPSAMEESLAAHLEIREWAYLDRPELHGVQSWAATGRTKPNDIPWSHLGDLKHVASLMRSPA